MDGFTSVSIIGMCKNAGKTTALCGIIREFERDARVSALTSIGRDGESTDIVTSTPKPRIYVYKDTLIATAADTLSLCDITREILDTTGISTPMGEVVIVRALSDGYVQLAGPSTVEGLTRVSDMMRFHGAERVIIDGAISRKSLSTPELCQAVVLCTGASYSPDMNKVVRDTAHTARLLNLPKTEIPFRDAGILKSDNLKYIFIDENSESVPLPQNTDLLKAVKQHKNAPALFIAGAVTDAVLSPVLDSGVRGMEIIAENSSKILLTRGMFEKLSVRGISVRVTLPTRLAAITMNPYSAYGTDFDTREFHASLVRETGIPDLPIINVVSGEVIKC